jgi:hypothetical protein
MHSFYKLTHHEQVKRFHNVRYIAAYSDSVLPNVDKSKLHVSNNISMVSYTVIIDTSQT